jgi:putative oxidoreductase
MKCFFDWLFHPKTNGHPAILIIRIIAGLVFIGEGILKFLYASQGVKRFTLLGFPYPEFTAHAIGVLEIVGGILLILGLFTNIVAIIFLIQMLVAFLSTKISMYNGTSPLALPPAPPQTGFWAVVHESRSDYSQLLLMLFLLITGPGKWSLDRFFSKDTDHHPHQ